MNISLIVLAFIIVLLSGCKALDGYERRYSIGHVDREGNRVDLGVTLIPRAPIVKPTK